MESHIVNSFGLGCDIVGALLIFFYGIPPAINREGHSFLALDAGDEAMQRTAKRYDCRSKGGLLFLIVGFSLQLVSNFLK